MKSLHEATELDIYDTAINVIGGLKDCSVLLMAIESHFSELDTLTDLINQRNEFLLRTERSRTRIEREVRKCFLRFQHQDHQDLIQGIFSDPVPLRDKQLFLLWQFALTNRLFREITATVFATIYFSGRASISKEDIIAYIKDIISRNESLQNSWSQSTINTLATKYLNLMTKLGCASSGRIKTFHHLRPSSEALVIFLYFAQLYAPHSGNILANELLPISFIPAEDFHERLKKLSLKGFFHMNFNGVTLNIELIHSYKGVCHVLYC